MLKYIITILLVLSTIALSAQNQKISGVIKDSSGRVLEGVSVSISHHKRGTISNANGEFQLHLPKGNHQLKFSHMNWKTKLIDITLDTDKIKTIILEPKQNESIEEVSVVGKVGIKKIKESSYNVTVLDAKPTYNTSMEVTTLLNKAAGVKIRQEAGLGSDYNISLNGFTGRAVKIFMDGVPMEGFGSAYNLNNIPTTMLDNIQIYKGVSPIEFGGDAMGGVINIVSRPIHGTTLDASYSLGSFNTHKSNINMAYVSKKGFVVDVRAIQNYSDNNYSTYTKSLNLDNETFSESKSWYKRFNDTYHNESLVAKIGFVNQKWADQLYLGTTLGREYKEIQNAYQQQLVYGMRHQKGTTLMPNFLYAKRNLFTENLDFRINANYNRNNNQNVDTAARTYNWEGNYKKKKSVGEGASTLSKFSNYNGSITSNLKYNVGENHFLNVNNTFTYFTRKSRNDLQVIDELTARDTMRSATNKNVLGVSYLYDSKKNWNATAFYKLYSQHVVGPVDTSSVSSRVNYAEQSRNTMNSGYGLTGTYFLNNVQLKVSYEKAFRLLSSNELFGDETLETANTSLKPEKSDNINFNVSYNKTFNKHHDFYVEAGFIYRNTYDYIRRVVEQRYGTISSVNHGNVLSVGGDFEARYAYKNRLLVGAAFSYLATRNQQRYSTPTSTQESITYKDQLPNIPYVFGNLDVQYVFPYALGKHSALTVGYASTYIYEFYLGWPSQGSEKYILPTQFSHDAFVTASLKKGKYNLSLESKNFTNELLYDNFELQKPGRYFSVKLRYFFNKSNQK